MNETHPTNKKKPAEAIEKVFGSFIVMGYWQSGPLIDRLFHDVVAMFHGEFPGLLPIDMRYHNLDHTLQATVCLCKILEGRHAAIAQPALSRRDCELAVAAALLHDAGYLKETHDTSGTGAKYTMVHEARSCRFAARYLPGLGFSPSDIETVTAAICCTGPENRIAGAQFTSPQGRVIARVLVTADYLSQMAAPDYIEKLPYLYRELEESYAFEGIPADKRRFASAQQLLEKTPEFWDDFVRPMLDEDLGSVYQFIANGPDGTNPYLSAIERNVASLRSVMPQ